MAELYRITPVYSDELLGTKSGKSRIKRVYQYKVKGKWYITSNKTHAKRNGI